MLLDKNFVRKLNVMLITETPEILLESLMCLCNVAI